MERRRAYQLLDAASVVQNVISGDAVTMTLDVFEQVMREQAERAAKAAVREVRPLTDALRWFTLKDIQKITGFSKNKVLSLHRKGKIPFFHAPDSNELRITQAAWQKCETRLVKEGLLPHI